MEIDTEFVTKIALLLAFVLYFPSSAICYYYSRHDQRKNEIDRYIDLLKIDKPDLFRLQHPCISLSIALTFITLLTGCFWALVLFGEDSGITGNANFLLGGASIIGSAQQGSQNAIYLYQSGALLTFNMSFTGAYLWGLQQIARRYAMNDLIPAAYYNVGVRMIFATLLALVFYHLSKMIPDFLSPLFSTPEEASNSAGGNSSHLLMPIVAFLIGLFPQRGLQWLTSKFSIFTREANPSVRDLPLEMVEGITLYDRVRLQEMGIDSCYDLANLDYIPYLFKTPYSPRILIDWILQAKLCVYFGEQVSQLREHGIHTVWQLRQLDEETLKMLAKNTTLTEDTLLQAYRQIATNKEIQRLVLAQLKLSRYWNPDDTEDMGDSASGGSTTQLPNH
jgi:Na+-transporting methylmalonyl-CoA/oxaloacetate decarboxylase gamma subunit